MAVAARDPQRARAFADEHGVERVLDSYQAVLDNPEVEVFYNPLPNSLHAEWNIRAARAGKHVGVVFLEAFQYPYHALFQRVCALLDDQAVGEVEHISAILRMPAPSDSDPRWSAANMHLVDAAFAAGGIERPHHGSAVSIAKGHEVR